MIVIIYRKVLIDMHLEERRINSKTIFEGKVITLQKDKAEDVVLYSGNRDNSLP